MARTKRKADAKDFGTNERYQHDDFELVEVRPREGVVARNATPDVVARMYRAGSLNDHQEYAATLFMEDFNTGRLTPNFHIVDLNRVGGGNGDMPERIYSARQRVNAALKHLGDPIAQAVVWYAVGCSDTLQNIGIRIGRNKHVVSGILQASLGVLVGHYRLTRKP